MHEEIFQSPMATICFVNRFLTDLEVAHEPGQGQRESRSSTTNRAGWIAPQAGRTKINVDAAVAKSTARGAVGVVCRSEEGAFLGASAMVYEGITDPGSLEALACREALNVADDLLLGTIQVASDCLPVVKGLHDAHFEHTATSSLRLRRGAC